MNQTQENIQQEQASIPLTPKVLLYPMMWGLFAVLMSIATVAIPPLAIVTVAFGSVSFAMMRLFAPSTAYERLLPVIYAVVSLLITNNVTLTFFLLGTFLPGGYMMSWVIGKRKSLNYAVASQLLVYALFTVAVFVILMGEYGDFKLENILEPFAATVKEALGASYDFAQTLPALPVQNMPTDPDSMIALPEYSFFLANLLTGETTKSNFIYDGYMFTLQIIPSVIAVTLMAIGALSYWMAKGILRRNKTLDRESVKFFSNFDTFRVSTVGAIIYLVLSALAFFVADVEISVILSTIVSVLSVAFCYEGLSLISFFMNIRGFGPFARRLILVILFCMIPLLSNIISILGLLDCFWNLRQFVRPSGRYM